MTDETMLQDLAGVVRLVLPCVSDSERMEVANEMADFIRKHHAEIARLTAENVELRTLNKVLEMYYFDARTDLIAARAKLKEHVHD